jgi:hypothetical protein
MLTSRELPRSVVHLPELLPPSYRNRARNLSPRNRNQDVHDQPESHMPPELQVPEWVVGRPAEMAAVAGVGHASYLQVLGGAEGI